MLREEEREKRREGEGKTEERDGKGMKIRKWQGREGKRRKK